MKELVIRPNEAGQRFDKFLAKYMNLAPKSFFYKMLRKKNIVLNGKKAAGNEILSAGDVVKLFLSDETIEKFSRSEQEPPAKLQNSMVHPEIIYEDSQVIFINKPAGVLSQKASADDVSLVEYLISYLVDTGQLQPDELRTFRPSVCNRLDRNTSGIIAAGKTLPALQQLSSMFRDRSLEKYYLCLAAGQIKFRQKIEGYLTKDSRTNRVRLSDQYVSGASRIETAYRPVASAGGFTLLEVHLITGKTHQIRAHLASQGYPIIGDFKYGDKKLNKEFRNKYGLTHQLLHAARLVFPDCNGVLSGLSGREFRADLPEIFNEVCAGCGIQIKGDNIYGNLEFTRPQGFNS